MAAAAPADPTGIKIVVVGDGAVGKTCLLHTYIHNKFPDGYSPTVFDNYTADVLVGSKPIKVHFWDTAGQEEYDQIRSLSYPNTHVFMLCFSIDSPGSMENIRTKWFPEVAHYCPKAPVLLVGTKIDLRKKPEYMQHLKDMQITPCSKEDGDKLAKDIGAVKYVEVAAITGDGLKAAFDEAIGHGMKKAMAGAKPAATKKGCSFL